MKFRIKVEAEIIITADGVMQANTVWESLRKEGKPKLMCDCYASMSAPNHDYRDHQRHRACVQSKITSMTKLEPIANKDKS